jgi:hypothetical protein
MTQEIQVQFFKKFNARRMRRDWWWRAIHTNGNIMAGSLQGYTRLIDCEAAQRKVANRLASAERVFLD